MDTAQRLDAVRRAYARGARDVEHVLRLCRDDVVFHIAGSHPLAGDHAGKRAVRRYLQTVQAVLAGRGGFTVTACITDEELHQMLVEGTLWFIEDGEPPEMRTLVHVLRTEQGLIVELWEHAFEPAEEDRFWRRHLTRAEPGTVPEQRSRVAAARGGRARV